MLLEVYLMLVSSLCCGIVYAQTDIHLFVENIRSDPYHIRVPADLVNSSDLTHLLCDHESIVTEPVLVDKCSKDIVPVCEYLLPMNGSIFVTLSPSTTHLESGADQLFRATFQLCDGAFMSVHIVVSVTTDSLRLRRYLLAELLGEFCFKTHIEPLYQIITPDIETDFNAQVYKGLNYLDNLELVVRDDEAFDSFKNFDVMNMHTDSSGFDIIHVIFRVWHDSKTMARMLTALSMMKSKSPALFGYLPQLTAVDNSVGHPVTNLIADSIFSLDVSPVQVRYLLEAWMLHDFFGTTGLSDKHILEIGGGYGGMAVTMSIMFSVKRYTIVDLEPAGRLQQKYVAAVNARNDLARPVAVLAVPSTSTSPLASDLLISFFAISELNRQTVDKYLTQYVTHAPSGYLQLNYDDDMDEVPPEMAAVLYTVMELFRRVYQLHPTAIMLPPPSYHIHHRIVWKPAEHCTPECRKCVSDMLVQQ
jgi:putative sugar O-methyltransferase